MGATSEVGINDVRRAAQEARAIYEKALGEARKIGAQAFANVTKPFFAEHPGLESFEWHQEDDVYNDETYEFQVSRDAYDVEVNGVHQDDIYNYDRETRKSIVKSEYTAIEDLFDDVADFLGNFSEDDLRLMFGDYATITVDRQGVTVTEG
jgi:hypothetical protein